MQASAGMPTAIWSAESAYILQELKHYKIKHIQQYYYYDYIVFYLALCILIIIFITLSNFHKLLQEILKWSFVGGWPEPMVGRMSAHDA